MRARLLPLYVAYCAAVALLLAGCAEVALRALGEEPWVPNLPSFSVDPGGRLFQPDGLLGYTNLPGRYRVRFRTGHLFVATHGDDTLRHTSAAPVPRGDKDEIWVLGGSFTYGWAVNDDETYPWMLQQALPSYRVVNFGVNGYGTVHSVVQLDREIAAGRRVRAVVLAYGSFHDVRNTFVRARRKRVAPYSHLGPLVQPYARWGPDGALQLQMAEVAYRPWPLMSHSALVHRLEGAYNGWERDRADSLGVTGALVERFVRSARATGAVTLVATLTRDGETQSARAHARDAGAELVDLQIDLERPGYRNVPHDEHPSGRAHAVYAQRLRGALARAGVE